MKRLISLCLILCLVGTPVATAADLAAFQTADGTALWGLLRNPTQRDATGTVYVALYRNGLLMDVQSVPHRFVPAGAIQPFQVTFPNLSNGYDRLTAKGMFWDSANAPLQDVSTQVFISGQLPEVIQGASPLSSDYVLAVNPGDRAQSTGTLPRANTPTASLQPGAPAPGVPRRVDVRMLPALPEAAGREAPRRQSIQPARANAQVGDTAEFSTANFQAGRMETIQARLMAAGSLCNVWVEVRESKFTRDMAQAAADEFDQTIFPAVSEHFADPTDGGSRKVDLLYYDIQDGFSYYNPFYTTGYFDRQEFADGRMLHLDTYPSLSAGNYYVPKQQCQYQVDKAFSTIAHEFQHMANHGVYYADFYEPPYDPNCIPMATWLNEAFAMAAEDMIYGTLDSRLEDIEALSGAICQGVPLLDWTSPADNDTVLAQYALCYVFGQYLKEQTAASPQGGDHIFKTVLTAMDDTPFDYTVFPSLSGDPLSVQKSKAVLTKVLQDIGLGLTFEEFLTNFYIAMCLKQPTGPYGFYGKQGFERLSMPVASPTEPLILPGTGAVLVRLSRPFSPDGAGENLQFIGLTNRF